MLPHPKRGEQSVGRDHIGATPGISDTRIGTDDQRFDWRSERSRGSDSRGDFRESDESLGGAVDQRDGPQ